VQSALARAFGTFPVCCYTFAMTQILQQAIKTLQTLPDETQNAIAAKLLEEIEDAKWQVSFDRPESDTLFAQMQEEIRTARKNKETLPIDCE
jgi:hypothetical protein